MTPQNIFYIVTPLFSEKHQLFDSDASFPLFKKMVLLLVGCSHIESNKVDRNP